MTPLQRKEAAEELSIGQIAVTKSNAQGLVRVVRLLGRNFRRVSSLELEGLQAEWPGLRTQAGQRDPRAR